MKKYQLTEDMAQDRKYSMVKKGEKKAETVYDVGGPGPHNINPKARVPV